MERARRGHRQMLEVALAPSPVTRGETQKCWRAFFEGAAQAWHHSDRPSCSPHQRRFDEIVAENVSAERLAARQLGEALLLRKVAHPNDGVVAPIGAFGAAPPVNACRDQ